MEGHLYAFSRLLTLGILWFVHCKCIASIRCSKIFTSNFPEDIYFPFRCLLSPVPEQYRTGVLEAIFVVVARPKESETALSIHFRNSMSHVMNAMVPPETPGTTSAAPIAIPFSKVCI